MPAILFVCTANRIRSPMAAALFRARLVESLSPDVQSWFQIYSAGTRAVPGLAPIDEAVQVMAGRGLDIRDHRSHEVSEALMAEADLILVMEPTQAEALRIEFPHVAGRVHLLSTVAGEKDPIQDPIGKSLATFEAVALQIDSLLGRGFERILTLAQQRGA